MQTEFCEEFHGKELLERLQTEETRILKGWLMKMGNRRKCLTVQS